ncbi:MAG: heavy-metal-associated domain-containing protein [Candidatus Entotheonellia bacterium]
MKGPCRTHRQRRLLERQYDALAVDQVVAGFSSVPLSGMPGRVRHQLTVIGEQTLHCAGCEEHIQRALRRLPGIQEVQARADTQQVEVTLDADRVTPDQVQAKLEQLGYQVAP